MTSMISSTVHNSIKPEATFWTLPVMAGYLLAMKQPIEQGRRVSIKLMAMLAKGIIGRGWSEFMLCCYISYLYMAEFLS